MEDVAVRTLMWSVGGVGLTAGFAVLTSIRLWINKLDKEAFEKHCREQKKEAKSIYETLNKTNILLAKVETKLDERT